MIDVFFIGKLRGSSLPPHPSFGKKTRAAPKEDITRKRDFLPTFFGEHFCYTFPGVPHCKHSFASWFSELQKEAFHYEYFPLKTGGKMIVFSMPTPSSLTCRFAKASPTCTNRNYIQFNKRSNHEGGATNNRTNINHTQEDEH